MDMEFDFEVSQNVLYRIFSAFEKTFEYSTAS